jgi:hypothetical protein
MTAVAAMAAALCLSAPAAAGNTTITGSVIGDQWFGDLYSTQAVVAKIDFETVRFNPAAGVYHVEGVEEFTGCLAVPGPDRCGTLTFRFQAWGRLDAAGNTLRGGCQHWIVASGGGLAGATGFIAMIDTPETAYTGHIAL